MSNEPSNPRETAREVHAWLETKRHNMTPEQIAAAETAYYALLQLDQPAENLNQSTRRAIADALEAFAKTLRA